MIKLSKKVEGNLCTIYVNGILDYATMEPFNKEIQAIEEGTKKVIINFAELEFIDSTGVGSIINLVHEANTKHFEVELDGVSDFIHEILETIGVFQIMETLQKEGQ
ncbi:STAS domain-containing protein [Oceanobacillus salinisoli]|uniref:STAS domain-containing protein n=1 Tax=Oceanobacillus salinisoli TaxID=2678611 RepID=UPI001E381706|nr:STAS domain-containing protein [Oceanobacillus salinisoli]